MDIHEAMDYVREVTHLGQKGDEYAADRRAVTTAVVSEIQRLDTEDPAKPLNTTFAKQHAVTQYGIWSSQVLFCLVT